MKDRRMLTAWQERSTVTKHTTDQERKMLGENATTGKRECGSEEHGVYRTQSLPSKRGRAKVALVTLLADLFE